MEAELKSVSVDGAVTERGTAFYMVFVESAEGDQQRRWAVAKRYSHFVDFRGKIEPLLTDLAPGMDQLPFPKKGWGTGTGSETVEERMSMFQAWIEAVCEVVLDEGLRAAGLPQVSHALLSRSVSGLPLPSPYSCSDLSSASPLSCWQNGCRQKYHVGELRDR